MVEELLKSPDTNADGSVLQTAKRSEGDPSSASENADVKPPTEDMGERINQGAKKPPYDNGNKGDKPESDPFRVAMSKVTGLPVDQIPTASELEKDYGATDKTPSNNN